MKDTIHKRWSRKAIRVGNSLAVTIPFDLAIQWQVTRGTELVMYQVDRALILLPLTDILKTGTPQLLEDIAQSTR